MCVSICNPWASLYAVTTTATHDIQNGVNTISKNLATVRHSESLLYVTRCGDSERSPSLHAWLPTTASSRCTVWTNIWQPAGSGSPSEARHKLVWVATPTPPVIYTHTRKKASLPVDCWQLQKYKKKNKACCASGNSCLSDVFGSAEAEGVEKKKEEKEKEALTSSIALCHFLFALAGCVGESRRAVRLKRRRSVTSSSCFITWVELGREGRSQTTQIAPAAMHSGSSLSMCSIYIVLTDHNLATI